MTIGRNQRNGTKMVHGGNTYDCAEDTDVNHVRKIELTEGEKISVGHLEMVMQC